MQLTPALAAKYASYRSRFLFGTDGVYVPGTPVPPCTSVPNVEFQQQNVPAAFLSHCGSPPVDPGTYLNANILALNDITDPQSSTVVDINHGDNIIYGSFAAINFAAEYAITLDLEPLQFCLNIVLAMQRLGTYQGGLNDPPSPSGSHGFMLRADSPDDGDPNENICVWAQDPENAKNLEPSYDQYCGLLSSLRVVQLVLADVPPVASHAATRGALDAAIAERVETCVGYLAASFWTVLWKNRGGHPRVEPGRLLHPRGLSLRQDRCARPDQVPQRLLLRDLAPRRYHRVRRHARAQFARGRDPLRLHGQHRVEDLRPHPQFPRLDHQELGHRGRRSTRSPSSWAARTRSTTPSAGCSTGLTRSSAGSRTPPTP